MRIFAMILAILAGIFTTIESSINAQLGKYITPSLATLHSLIIGSIMMLLICFCNGSIGKYTKIFSLNPILLIGGIFGAMIIFFTSIAIPNIGISDSIILILTGQLISGLVMDVYMNHQDISTKKGFGLVLFIIGVILYLRE